MKTKNSTIDEKRADQPSARHQCGVVPVLGIDVSKQKLDACMILLDGTQAIRTVSNTPEGYKKLHEWAIKRADIYCACLESTGSYGEPIATYLFEQKMFVSMVNPSQTNHYAKAQLRRTKTDRVDAQTIAMFARSMLQDNKLPRYQPLPAELHILQELVRQRSARIAERVRVSNQQSETQTEVMKKLNNELHAFLVCQIEAIDHEIEALIDQYPSLKRNFELLSSIPGVGPVTASVILVELPSVELFEHAKQVAAYSGLTPRTRHSGSREPLSQPITKTGNRHIRKALYMAAMSAMQHQPALKAMAERLGSKGKPFKKVIVAVMRKLTHLIYAVLKNQTRFDLNYKNVVVGAN